jgi:hypothetical protein
VNLRRENAANARPRGFDQERDRFADFLHTALNHNIALADRKAAILFTLVSAALVYLLEARPMAVGPEEPSLLRVVWAVVLGSLLVSASGAFAAVFPRLRRPHHGLTFFGRIAANADPKTYLSKIDDIASGGLTDAKLEHCHILSRVAVTKFRLLRFSMMTAALGLLLFIAASVAGTFA